jgi:hypothetical protein
MFLTKEQEKEGTKLKKQIAKSKAKIEVEKINIKTCKERLKLMSGKPTTAKAAE